ncbi:hypothetical protein ColTof4_12662 [Colletotrichum tofieldiae]|nr:hypothetical protein ColTof3_06385 [Colletotrichum tofieldiae]GKT80239.1 hypothetical protein ColTof4_12662 [Colletotrichum tofieldiae]GKT85193.1 hypothetical protein Ct61P_03043 [Colletotrichum tofieldiae]
MPCKSEFKKCSLVTQALGWKLLERDLALAASKKLEWGRRMPGGESEHRKASEEPRTGRTAADAHARQAVAYGAVENPHLAGLGGDNSPVRLEDTGATLE